MTDSSQASRADSKRRSLLKPATVVFATFLSLLGSAGQFFFIENYDEIIGQKAGEMRAIEQQISTLRENQGEYFTAYIHGNLLFVLNPNDTSGSRGAIADMYRLALLDRGFPFRAILAELAISGLFTFKDANDQYAKLRDAASADFSYASYMALANFEKGILDKMIELQGVLKDRYFVLEEEKAKAEAARDQRRTWLVVLTAIGTILLLAANLIAEKERGKAS